jgi:hypothetical protein
VSWCSRRRWRASCQHRDRMRPVRDEALALLQAIDAGLTGFRLTGRTCCLAFSKASLGSRRGEIAIRPLTRYLRAEIRAADRELRA